ncbi:hypothetical protein ACFE04_007985 [Oxalis oulophora]
MYCVSSSIWAEAEEEETLTEFSKRRVSENKFFHNTSTSTVTVDWDSSLWKDESSSDNDVNLVAFEEEEEEEEKIKVKKEKEELFGFSRSEVTVIDTSFDVWKFDKLLFRKKNVRKKYLYTIFEQMSFSQQILSPELAVIPFNHL